MNYNESGFGDQPAPEGELPDIKAGDIDKIIEEAGKPSKKEKTGENLISEVDVIDKDVVNFKNGDKFRVKELKIHPALPGGGTLVGEKISASGEVLGMDRMDFIEYFNAKKENRIESIYKIVGSQSDPLSYVEVGNIIVSKSDTKREVLSVTPDPIRKGEGYIECNRTDKEGNTSSETITFSELIDGHKRGNMAGVIIRT